MKSKIYLSSPHLGDKELEYVHEAFRSNWVAPLGPNVDGFEHDLAEYTGVRYAAALSSGTAAIHLALVMLGVGRGDVVICQSFTFSGTANPIAYVGAHPVFIDSESETWNMCPDHLQEAITDLEKKGNRPKAIIPVHLYGMPAKMDRILEIARQFEIPVIEDAAEALGSSIQGRKCGSFGDIGILSFNGNKIITTSGGGALLSDNKDFVVKARFLATQAREPAPHYEHKEIGYNYRMSNVVAGIGRGQMQVLEDRIWQRRKNFERYKEIFSEINNRGYCIKWLDEPEGFFSNRWLTTVILDPMKNNGINREKLRLAFESEMIESRPLWKPMHLQPVFAKELYYGEKISEQLFVQGLCLPSGSNLTDDDWKRIEDVIYKVFA
ncbi:DegT/DnrJ/EryC1/StrS family aminotransferase [Schleiferia thermophila]|uniref:GDP-perosamine synthase n=1 Tax=Schleiferia thermophila TaxID=884107 RepID=A0A369AC61_9FLAO|nr:aminotransferase class I/II-fold pyridoxal phosphate-dependent enzyme [Schleiferia thermophila]RCX05677.1 dTDP-4-amino-4,6-dideoxygalactose transaminase [Schleiferia thermophila]GCD78834.1 pyridoxal phosphate-dependent aminotransferase [Schleiferia thermophila]